MAETLGEFLAQVQRSMGGGAFGRATGPMAGYLFGPDFFRKQTYLQITDTFVATYGKKVWDALNNRTVTWNALRKVDWGPTVGWRLRSDRGSGRSRPVTETGSLPTVDVSAYEGVYGYPKIVGTTFGVSLKAQAVSGLEGGIGNQLAVEQEASSRDHIKEINQELIAGNAYLCSGGSTTTYVVPSSVGGHFKVGDTVDFVDAGTEADEPKAVTGVSAGTITVGTHSTGGADGDVVFIEARAGLTSLMDILMEDTAASGDTSDVGGSKAYVKTYNLSTRTAGAYAAPALCDYNAGVGRDLSIALVDKGIRKVREAGGEPKLIIMGLDQYDKFNQLLLAHQRYVDYQEYVVGVGDERTYPGTRAGFQLATYRGIPILPEPDMPTSVDTDDAVLGTDILILDTDYLEVGVMYPTQYLENRDYFAANALVMRGLFFTMAELRALRFDVHSHIADLTA